MTMVERPMAGPGLPGTVLAVVERAGWRITSDENANVFASPAEGNLLAAFLPEANELVSREVLWLVRAYDKPALRYSGEWHSEVLWEARFTADTPAEFVAAFLADLTRDEPLDPDRDDDDIPDPTPAVVGSI